MMMMVRLMDADKIDGDAEEEKYHGDCNDCDDDAVVVVVDDVGRDADCDDDCDDDDDGEKDDDEDNTKDGHANQFV